MEGVERVHPRVAASEQELADFCRRWKIAKLELFGSVLRDDFDERSEIDVLVTFDRAPEQRLDTFLSMEEELQRMFGRHVDVVDRRLVEANPNWIRRRSILQSAQLLYAAA